MGLTRDDVIKFHTEGYAGPFDAFDAEKAREYREFMNANIVEWFAGDSKYLSNMHLFSKTVFNAITSDPIKEAVRMILGENLLLFKAGFIIKRPANESDNINWHQDSNYRLISPYNAIAVWLAFDDITAQNGCVEVLPGTQWHDVPHLKTNDSYFSTSADPDYFNSSAPTTKLLCKAGQFFILNERLIHRSEVNRAAETRMALVGRFAATNVYLKSPKTASILVSGEDHYKYNLMTAPPTQL